MTWTGMALWVLAWPEVPWEDASEQDKRLFNDHADSLNMYEETR